jgi:DNA-binding FadR family transcriptional regulator
MSGPREDVFKKASFALFSVILPLFSNPIILHIYDALLSAVRRKIRKIIKGQPDIASL